MPNLVLIEILIVGGASAVLAALVWKIRRVIKLRKQAMVIACETARIPLYRSNVEAFSRELRRARRYQRPLSVAVLRVEPGPPDVKAATLPRTDAVAQLLAWRMGAAFPSLGYLLRECLREIDVVAYDPAQNQYIIAFPEASRKHATAALGRLADIASNSLQVNLRTGFAVFPQQGVVVEELVGVAAHACEGTRVTILTPPTEGALSMLSSERQAHS